MIPSTPATLGYEPAPSRNWLQPQTAKATHACPGMPRTRSVHGQHQCARAHSICTRMPVATKKTSGTQLILRPPAEPSGSCSCRRSQSVHSCAYVCWACTLSASRSGVPVAIQLSNMVTSCSRPAEL
eukprot:15470204-Alexandrium_andersonii.AAC.1